MIVPLLVTDLGYPFEETRKACTPVMSDVVGGLIKLPSYSSTLVGPSGPIESVS